MNKHDERMLIDILNEYSGEISRDYYIDNELMRNLVREYNWLDIVSTEFQKLFTFRGEINTDTKEIILSLDGALWVLESKSKGAFFNLIAASNKVCIKTGEGDCEAILEFTLPGVWRKRERDR